uniref:Vacuolar protein sorting-associated protein 29 n=1 Tax=Corethron hystrix TaxID=216773 RepID=A0A7S1BNH9_9STRA|mmetsp:Transcript_3268/g.6033  ORF Transcript_3268/g.6033 Transcript_3268/m.6033 type:complete len:205 (+) Transcript_3268:118-732(+)
MSNSFGELCLVVGDFHIPHRATGIPEKFKRMLVPNKMQHVLCTGNLCTRGSGVYEELRSLAPNVHCVLGDMDDDVSANEDAASATRPETKVVKIGQFRIGLVHGHQAVPWGDHGALDMVRRRLGADILISGHTHRNAVTPYDGHYHINPGSITGAGATVGAGESCPSFILLAIQGPKVVCYVYELIDDNVEVSKTEFSKSELAT